MKPLDRADVEAYIHIGIERFHSVRQARLAKINLQSILKKNPYLFRAKHLMSAADLVRSMLDALLSSSEEKAFGDFLESVAIYICEQTCGGRKSSARGIDLEYDDEGVRYLVAIKSGWNWGNSSQYQALETNFRNALRVQAQAQQRAPSGSAGDVLWQRAKS